MTITAELADGRRLEFPDNTPQEVVQSAVKRTLLGGQPQTTQSAPSQVPQGGELQRPAEASPFEPQAQQPQLVSPGPIPQESQSTLVPGATFGENAPLPQSLAQETLVSAAKAIPGSAAQFGKDIVSPITHPIETAKSLAGLGLGIVQKIIPGEQESEKFADAFVDFAKERYGSLEKTRETFATDPVGFATDLSVFLTGAGAVLKVGKVGKVAKIGQTLSKAGAAIEPITIGIKSVVKPLARSSFAKNLPVLMFKRSAKISKTIKQSDRTRIIQAALDNGIGLTVGGVDKARKFYDDFNLRITKMVNNATKTGKTIKVKSLFTELKELRRQASLSDMPEGELRKINNIAKQVNRFNAKLRKGLLTPNEAHQFKKNIYDRTYSLHGKQKANITRDTRKSIARRAKEELEKLNPNLKGANINSGTFKMLISQIDDSVNRISNNNLFSLRNVITVGAGGAAFNGPGIVAGLAISVAADPRVQAQLAILLNKTRKAVIKRPPQKGILTRQALVQAGRLERSKGDSQ